MTAKHNLQLVNIPLNVPSHRQLMLGVKPFSDFGVSQPIAGSRIWESYNTAFIQAVLRAGDTFLDIGAHVGYFTVVAADKVGKTGRVYAFEPEPENAALLEYNVLQNGFEGDIRVFKHAVGAENKQETLYQAAENHGAHQLTFQYRDGVDTTGIQVPVRALDSMLEEVPGLENVDFIKMDVQGYEMQALLGMEQLIEKNREHLVMLLEFSPSLLARFESENLGQTRFLAWLETNAYEVFYVKRTPTADLSVSLARIKTDQLNQLSEHLLRQSERDGEDRCADLCCVFSKAASEKMLAKMK
jgi:FkbM family methyltransferase